VKEIIRKKEKQSAKQEQTRENKGERGTPKLEVAASRRKDYHVLTIFSKKGGPKKLPRKERVFDVGLSKKGVVVKGSYEGRAVSKQQPRNVRRKQKVISWLTRLNAIRKRVCVSLLGKTG